jgi:hypothetical protein
LLAALAVWDYCKQSANNLFNNKAEPESIPDPLWLRVLKLIQSQPGISKAEITNKLQRYGNSVGITNCLHGLKEKQLAYSVYNQSPNGGPKKEQWYPGSPEGETVDIEPTPQTNTVCEPAVPDSREPVTNPETDKQKSYEQWFCSADWTTPLVSNYYPECEWPDVLIRTRRVSAGHVFSAKRAPNGPKTLIPR